MLPRSANDSVVQTQQINGAPSPAYSLIRLGPASRHPNRAARSHRAISASTVATTTALPLDDPPTEWVGLRGLRTGSGLLRCEKQRSSQAVLPRIVPPACIIRVTTVASSSRTYPSSTCDPFLIGIPATQMLSLIATR